MKKKYQVFVSSTYEDLQEERKKVMEALLQMDCFPVGMEYFNASDASQWELIKSFIRECDYYVLIVTGRYGSIEEESGKSYTQKEFEYAIEQGIPVISFVHKHPESLPGTKIEQEQSKRDKLEAFKSCVKKKVCKFWENADELASQVVLGLNREIAKHSYTSWVKVNRDYGIKGVYYDERASTRIKEQLSEIKELKILAVSGTNISKSLESDFVKLLTQNHAVIKILVGSPYSDFIKDVEACESYDLDSKSDTGLRKDMISEEIEHVVKNITICIGKAINKQKEENKSVMGHLIVKHFNTHMRSSIIIINNEWAWLTFNLPPAKALHSLSIEFYRKDKDSYINDIVNHFDTIFDLSTDCKDSEKLRTHTKNNSGSTLY